MIKTQESAEPASQPVLLVLTSAANGRLDSSNPISIPKRLIHWICNPYPCDTPNFPWWEKIDSITPRQGLTVTHPANAWHETHVWRGTGTRLCIVVNFQIIKPGYQSLHRPLRGYPNSGWPRNMITSMRPELPTAALRSSQATHAAVDNSAPSPTGPSTTYKSGKSVQTNGATSDGQQ